MPVGPTQIATPQRHAMTIKELKYLNRNLSSAIDPITKLRCDELSEGLRLGQIEDDPDHLCHGRAQKEMVQRHLINPPQAPEQFKQAPHVGFTNPYYGGET